MVRTGESGEDSVMKSKLGMEVVSADEQVPTM